MSALLRLFWRNYVSLNLAGPPANVLICAGRAGFVMARALQAGRLSLDYLLPIITAVWGNLHGGYAVAFMLAAAYLIGEIGNRLTRHADDPVLSWQQLGLLGGVMVVSLLTVALNPYGWQMWVYPLRTVGIDSLRDFIQEWRSPDFHATMTWPFAAMLVLTLVIMG